MSRILQMDRKVITGYACAIAASVLFGTVPVVSKHLTVNTDPILLASLAYVISALAFTPIAQKTTSVFSKRDVRLLAIISVCGAAVAPVMYFEGIIQSTASDTSILSNAEIVFTILLAVIIFKERTGVVDLAAVGLVFAGVILVVTNLQVSRSLFDVNAGHFMILGSTVFWALDTNLSKIISSKIDPARLVQIKYAIGGVITLGTAIALGVPLQIKTEDISYLVILATLSFGGSLYFFLQGLKRIGTVKTTLILAIPFGLVFANIFGHEQISTVQIIATLVILSGIYLFQMRNRLKQGAPIAHE